MKKTKPNRRLVTEHIADSPRPKLLDAPRNDKDALILSDVEIPFQNATWINNCIGLAREVFGIDALWLAGDFVHFGALAHFPAGDKDAMKEIIEIGDHLNPFLQFSSVELVHGNHDHRLSMLMDRQLTGEIAARLYVPPELAEKWHKRVRVSDYFYGYIGDEWAVEHPKATSVIPAQATADLVRYQNINTVMGHNHLVGMRQAGYDRHTGRTIWAVEIGCCVDPERLPYYMMRHTRRPRMENGAAIIRKQTDGHYACTLLTKDLFDWRAWKKLAR